MITKKHLEQRIHALELDLCDAVQKLAAIRGHLDRAGFSPHKSATDEVVRHVESLVNERLGYREGYIKLREENADLIAERDRLTRRMAGNEQHRRDELARISDELGISFGSPEEIAMQVRNLREQAARLPVVEDELEAIRKERNEVMADRNAAAEQIQRLRDETAEARALTERCARERNEAHERIAKVRDLVRQFARNSMTLAELL